ncbi:translin-associated protein X [Agrilus planipennis]|uniref:Translin-associated protein X n=1 Tax=Agrilus planipennis TaxID=224129 RepID=A0A1W4XMR8_AGRPL|nr:translin-associated protein X [Agrilus planipennis]
MSGKGSHRNKHYEKKNKVAVGEKAREALEQIDENSPIIKMFRQYAIELDDKHDRHERIVKLSRDITIESKRIIFLLHGSNVDLETKRDIILKEAAMRLEMLSKNFKSIATELKDMDAYQYLRAYTAGLQEYVEAVAFYQFLRFNELETWENLQEKFRFSKENDHPSQSEIVKLLFPATEFILGIADFTGELMRKCINSLGSGNIEDCFKICNIVKQIYIGFLGINPSNNRELKAKMYVLKQSLLKMENVCYNIKVRGSEVPKHMLAQIAIANTEQNEEIDEGFF